MNPHFRILSLLLLLGESSSAQHQPNERDYIVTFKEDTVYGRIQKVLLGKPKLETDTGTIICDARKIYSYYIASRKQLYRALTVPDNHDNAWALVLVDGPIVLYEYQSKRRTATDSYPTFEPGQGGLMTDQGDVGEMWFASREGVGLVQLLGPGSGPVKKKKMRMRLLIGDDPDILKTFDEMEDYSYFELLKLIKRYNERQIVREAGQ